MAQRQKTKVGGLLRLPPPASLTVILAIKGNNKSKDLGLVNWALDKFVAEGMFMFKLIHVRPTITTVRTAVGSFCLSDAEAYREEIHWQTEKRLQHYKKMCAQKWIHAEIVQLESDDVIGAISKEVVKSSVNTLVIGASSRGMLFSRRRNLSSEITESIPKFCTVYAVLKGKLASLRPSEFDGSIKEDRSEASMSTNSSPIRKSYSQSELTDSSSIASYASFPFPFHGLSTVNQTILYKKANSSGALDSRFTSLEFDRDDCMSSCPGSSYIGRPSSSLSSRQILETDTFSWVSHQPTFGDATTSDDRPEFSSENQVNDLTNLLLEESIKLGEINYEEEEAKELAIQDTSLEFDRDDCMSSCPGSSYIGRPSSSLSSRQILETATFLWVSHQATFGDATLDAMSKEVDKSTVDKLVIGASSHGGMCSRCRNESTDIAESMPKFCTVYTVSKGKLSSFRPPDLDTHRIITIPSRMIHSSSNESSFDNCKSQAGAAVDDHVGLHSVIQAPNCRPNQAVLNRGSQMQRHN